MGKWHLIQNQRTESHRKVKSLKHILVRANLKNLKPNANGRSPAGPSILFNSSFASCDLHLARSLSTLWCSKISASWLLVEPFCRNFLSFHRLKVAFRAKVLFVRTVALSLLCEGTRDAIDSSRYKKIPEGNCEKPLKWLPRKNKSLFQKTWSHRPRLYVCCQSIEQIIGAWWNYTREYFNQNSSKLILVAKR